jgi:plasmid stabilization system protein ParE
VKVRVRLAEAAQQALRHAPPAAKRELKRVLETMRKGSTGLDIRELRQLGPTRGPTLFRVRAGAWRMVFRLQGKDLEVVRVFHRRDGYGWMERLG